MRRSLTRSILSPVGRPPVHGLLHRSWLSSELTREQRIRQALVTELSANEETLSVEDLSGGCDGGTVRISVESPLFAGKTVVQQHRMVNGVIKEEMKSLHAAMIKTIKPRT